MLPTGPGVAFLSRGFGFLSLYLATFHYATKTLAANRGYLAPLWLVIVGALIAAPVIARFYVFAREWRHKRRARALGARMVPKVQGKMMGNYDILQKTMRTVATGYPGDNLVEIIAALGPVFNLDVMYSDMILTTSPGHIQTILATGFANYVKGERMHNAMGSVLGTGVFNSDGDMWKFHRDMTRPAFAAERTRNFDTFDRHADQALAKLKERLGEGYAVDFQDIMARFTLDTATEFLFGSCVHALWSELPYPRNASFVPHQRKPVDDAVDRFAEAFLRSQEIIANRERLSWIWPLFEIGEDKTVEPMKIVNAYIEPIVKDAIERKRVQDAQGEAEKREGEIMETKNKKLQDQETLLDYLLTKTMDPVVIRDEILNIMIAGRDTTAATLTYAVYLLSQNPDVFQRVRAEILEHVGPGRRPTFEDLKDLKYVRAVINETLRLFPVVPFNVRESVNEAVWPSPDPLKKPLYIPPGTKTAYSVFIMHRRKDLWGPDAEEFDPDRWLDARKEYHIKNNMIFLPFNAGPRICLGQQYAYNEMSFMLVRLLQNFSDISLDLSSAPADAIPPAEWAQSPGRKAQEKVWPKMHLTMYASGGLWLKMQEAENN